MKESLKKYYSNTVLQESLLFFILSIALLVYALINHYSVEIEWKMSPYLFPVLISAFLMGLSVSLFFDAKAEISGKGEVKEDKNIKKKNNSIKVFVTVVLALVYYASLPFIGFIPATIIFLGCLLYYLGERRWYMLLSVSVVTAVAIYFIFGKLLHVMLP